MLTDYLLFYLLLMLDLNLKILYSFKTYFWPPFL